MLRAKEMRMFPTMAVTIPMSEDHSRNLELVSPSSATWMALDIEAAYAEKSRLDARRRVRAL